MKAVENHRREQIAAPVEALRADVAALRHDIASIVSGGLGTLSGRAREQISWAGHSARDFAERSKKKAAELHDQLGDVVSERPITTIALAAVAGIVLFQVLTWSARRS